MKNFMKTMNATVAATALAASTILSVPAFAATQGTLGATSTGRSTINVTKTTQAEISGLSDMTLASYTVGAGDQALFTTACVYSSTSGGKYTVKATGSGASSAFTLTDGASHLIPYTVIWNSGGAGALGTTGASLTTNVASATLNNGSTTSVDCNAGANPTAQANVTILGTDLDAAPAGTYTGVLTLLVTPV